jgi:hypothetical protein
VEGWAVQRAARFLAVRDAGYLILQYWLFYAMNDWRSTFGGVNGHEADWEQIRLFLNEPDQCEPQLAWWRSRLTTKLEMIYDDELTTRIYNSSMEHIRSFMQELAPTAVHICPVTTSLRWLHQHWKDSPGSGGASPLGSHQEEERGRSAHGSVYRSLTTVVAMANRLDQAPNRAGDRW